MPEAHGKLGWLTSVSFDYNHPDSASVCKNNQAMTSVVHDVSGNHGADERQKQQRQGEPEDQQEASVTSTDSHTMVATPSTDYATPYAHHDMAHAMVHYMYFFPFLVMSK
jgi:hypothetical protein